MIGWNSGFGSGSGVFCGDSSLGDFSCSGLYVTSICWTVGGLVSPTLPGGSEAESTVHTLFGGDIV